VPRERAYWLVKSEPYKFPWSQLVSDGKACWDGVRNAEARNNLRDMSPGDLALFYHSGEGKEVVGIAEVAGSAYPDPTADDPRWLAVDVKPRQALAAPVSLAAIKGDAKLADVALVRRSRLSVVPLSAAHFKRILELGKTKL
jgi:predicted RNA-binding protein with PUA-like domain